MKRYKEPIFKLSREALTERLRISSLPLVDEIYRIVIRALETEQHRETMLDNKATALLASSGVAVTILFTFGGSIISQPPKCLSLFSSWLTLLLIVSFAAAMLAGLLSGIQGVRALRVREDQHTVREDAIFDEKELGLADTHDEKTAQGYYQRYITVHLWSIYQNNFVILDKKADIIKFGQIYFLSLMIFLMPIGLIMALAFSTAQKSEQSSASATQIQATKSVLSKPEAVQENPVSVPVPSGGMQVPQDSSPRSPSVPRSDNPSHQTPGSRRDSPAPTAPSRPSGQPSGKPGPTGVAPPGKPVKYGKDVARS